MAVYTKSEYFTTQKVELTFFRVEVTLTPVVTTRIDGTLSSEADPAPGLERVRSRLEAGVLLESAGEASRFGALLDEATVDVPDILDRFRADGCSSGSLIFVSRDRLPPLVFLSVFAASSIG
jgi:hypothetical protein